MGLAESLELIECVRCDELEYRAYKGYDAAVCPESGTPQVVLWDEGAEFSLKSPSSETVPSK